MKRILFFILLVFSIFLNALSQSINFDQPEFYSYKELLRNFEDYIQDTLSAKKYAYFYIEKAKKENDSNKISRGYIKLASISKPYKAIKYLDTSIVYSKFSNHKDFPTEGYLKKSLIQFNNEEYEKSLKNGILAYQYANKKNNVEQQIKALHQINAINELWGDYHKVLKTEFLAYNLLFENRDIKYFSENYLYSLEGIGKCYVRLKKPDSALYYFKKGIVEALKNKDTITYHAFVSRTGMALYEKGNYVAAIDSLEKGNIFKYAYNKSYLPYYYYYLGSCYYQQGKKETGISYFKKIDSIYKVRHVLNPELPLVYDKLVSYYRNKNNDQKQLEYLYKLIRVERIIDVKKSNIKNKTEKEYHIPKLLEDKEDQIADLYKRNKNSKILIWIAVFVVSLMVLFSGYYFQRQKKFKKRFEDLIALQEKQTKKPPTTDNEETNNGISIEIIEDILTKLSEFELKNKFLSYDISLIDLAKQFGTNSTYLSKVINLKKDKNFSQYLNDLRIEYIVNELKVNKKYRNYTIKAIANECGFKNSESFSKAFYKKYGIYPSYYLKNLKG